MNKGIWGGALAYLMWGLFPLYWKLLQHVSALEILAHRMIWSLVFLLLLLSARQQWRWLGPAWRDRRTLARFAGAGLLLSCNWGLYIWGVNAGYTVETSLGYFINPLVSVALGTLILKERLRPTQWAALSLALLGVIYLTLSYGRLPWIALALACSFAVYGLLKKQARLGALEGLTLETGAMLAPALIYLTALELTGRAAFGTTGWPTALLLAGGGVVTAVPLLLFAYGAQRVRLTTLGLLQYAAPTLQFLIAVFVFREPFPPDRWIGFGLIWLALVFYTAEGFYRLRHPLPLPQP